MKHARTPHCQSVRLVTGQPHLSAVRSVSLCCRAFSRFRIIRLHSHCRSEPSSCSRSDAVRCTHTFTRWTWPSAHPSAPIASSLVFLTAALLCTNLNRDASSSPSSADHPHHSRSLLRCQRAQWRHWSWRISTRLGPPLLIHTPIALPCASTCIAVVAAVSLAFAARARPGLRPAPTYRISTGGVRTLTRPSFLSPHFELSLALCARTN